MGTDAGAHASPGCPVPFLYLAGKALSLPCAIGGGCPGVAVLLSLVAVLCASDKWLRATQLGEIGLVVPPPCPCGADFGI